MRSKKVLVAVMALIACLAIGSATVATAKVKTKKFPATITLAVNTTQSPYAPYTAGAGNFSGRVSSGGPQGCRAGRTVSVDGPLLGTGTTDTNGNYVIPTSAAPPAGTYQAFTPKRVIFKKKKKKKFVCKSARSAPVVVP